MKNKFIIFCLAVILFGPTLSANLFQLPLILPGFNLNDLIDVNVPSPTNNFVLTWDSTTKKWIAVGADYAGVSVHIQAVATDIALVDSWEKFLFFDTNSPEYISDGDHTSNDITIGSTGYIQSSMLPMDYRQR